jgi:diguanylate cyclase (GGDEF)-like protein/PAS domain S-box-containing protein
MEETIRQSEEKYRTIIDEMDEWYFEIDLTGNIVFINDAVARSVGYSLKQLIGINYRSFIKKDQAGELYKIFRQVYETGEPTKSFPYEFIRPDGTITLFELSIFPKLDGEGKVFGFRGIGHDITERKRTEQQLNYIATHDPLTGLPNRILFMDRLKMALAQAKRNGQKLAAMMLDLDHFKNVNDTLGHMVGDQLLKEISLRLTGRLRQNDTISRLGGDEFIILLPAIERVEDSIEVAEIILSSFQQPFTCDDNKITSSVSIGIAIYPDDCEDIDSLLKNADMAMYYVKAHGRNGYHFFANIKSYQSN